MLDDKDIQKLSEVFATKEEARKNLEELKENLVPKEDFVVFKNNLEDLRQEMASKKDIQELREEMASKKDFEDLKGNLVNIFATRDEFREIKREIIDLREMAQALVISIDKMSKTIEDMRQEFISTTGKVDRHEKWLLQIADKIGLKLEY